MQQQYGYPPQQYGYPQPQPNVIYVQQLPPQQAPYVHQHQPFSTASQQPQAIQSFNTSSPSSQSQKTRTHPIDQNNSSFTKKQRFKCLRLYLGIFLQLFDFVSDILAFSAILSRLGNTRKHCSTTYPVSAADVDSFFDNEDYLGKDDICTGAEICNLDAECYAPLTNDFMSSSYCAQDCECCPKGYYQVIAIIWGIVFGIMCIKEVFRMIKSCRVGLSSKEYFGKGPEAVPGWMQQLHSTLWLIIIMIWNPTEWNNFVKYDVNGNLMPSRCNIFSELLMETIPSTVLVICDTVATEQIVFTNALSFGFSICMILYTCTWKVRQASEFARGK